jgi:hypothetical protein
MNPKDMTNEQFADAVEKRCEFNHEGPTMTDLRRRLDEADALRKENEELRKDKEKLLKDYAEIRVNSALLVACDDALEALELDNTKESEIDALRKDKARL